MSVTVLESQIVESESEQSVEISIFSSLFYLPPLLPFVFSRFTVESSSEEWVVIENASTVRHPLILEATLRKNAFKDPTSLLMRSTPLLFLSLIICLASLNYIWLMARDHFLNLVG